MRRAWGLVLLCLSACACVDAGIGAGAASARTLQVFPHRGALQRALARANRGDTLMIHSGHYYGQSVVSDRGLRLVGAPGAVPVIDGRCKTNDTIEITAPGVTVDHLQVVGAAEGFGSYPSEVNFDGQPTGTAENLVVRNTCNAEYGINVIQGSRQQIVGDFAYGFRDSGIYVGQIHQSGRGRPLLVFGNVADHNSRGIIIEFSSGDDIRVIGNEMNRNTLRGLGETPPAGLLLNGASNVLVRGNQAHHNGRYGFDLIASSAQNDFVGNDFRRNPVDLHVESGSGPNCGSGNLPAKFPHC
jgi:parallel beta-helix repeat protein